ncbi:unnamed protein product, partial [Urochloa humidicola]
LSLCPLPSPPCAVAPPYALHPILHAAEPSAACPWRRGAAGARARWRAGARPLALDPAQVRGGAAQFRNAHPIAVLRVLAIPKAA